MADINHPLKRIREMHVNGIIGLALVLILVAILIRRS